MRDGREVANYVLDCADKNEIEVTNLSLQKITYFCHAWYLVKTRNPLIKQNFEAWEFGPVLPYLYRFFKDFKDQKITSRITKIDPKTGNNIIARINMDIDEEKMLESIVSFYLRMSASQLVELTHTDGGPWYKAWNHDEKVNPGMQISNQEIFNFYTSKIKPYTVQ